jgi:MoxR-like ATPase
LPSGSWLDVFFDLTLHLPSEPEDPQRVFDELVRRRLVAPGRAVISHAQDGVDITWQRVRARDDQDLVAHDPRLTAALAAVVAVARRDGSSDAVPHVRLDLRESRRLTQADFDPAEDL